MVHTLFGLVMADTGQEFQITPNNREALNIIHRYLMNPGKTGIILTGPVGNGKTIMMRMLKECSLILHRRGIIEFNAPFVRANYYQEAGFDRISVAHKIHYYKTIIINDLGFERPYASGEDILQTVMFDRFESGKVTHGTTNLDPVEFTLRYNDAKNRMGDRFKQMFQFVDVKGDSFR